MQQQRERSYSLEEDPWLKHSRRKREEHKQSSSHPHQKETPGIIPQHSAEHPVPHYLLTQTTSSTASAHTSISNCQGLFPCQAHATVTSQPHWCTPCCPGPVLPPPLQTTRQGLMLPRAPHWPQPGLVRLQRMRALPPPAAQDSFSRTGLHLSLAGPDS